jgi:hypothetical protein
MWRRLLVVTRTTFSPTKEYLNEVLHQGIVTVKFTKTDGTERDMKCTLEESHIKPYEKKTTREKTVNADLFSVWDVEKEGWRSFRFDSVISVYK